MNTRSKDLAKIHMAKKDLGLDDDAYRDALWTVARVRSAKDLDEAGRRKVIAHFVACGWKSQSRIEKRKGYPGRPANCDKHPQLRKIEALLTDARRPWSYADAMAKRMFDKDKVAFCNSEEWHNIIAALTKDAERHGRGE